MNKKSNKELMVEQIKRLRGELSEATIVESYSEEEKRIVLLAVRKIMKYKNVDIKTAAMYVVGAAEELKKDIDKGKVKK
tara:strand:+ start:2657 stop:2893 length:237 start_codon:yes stop_codon:yes gene_type:complete